MYAFPILFYVDQPATENLVFLPICIHLTDSTMDSTHSKIIVMLYTLHINHIRGLVLLLRCNIIWSRMCIWVISLLMTTYYFAPPVSKRYIYIYICTCLYWIFVAQGALWLGKWIQDLLELFLSAITKTGNPWGGLPIFFFFGSSPLVSTFECRLKLSRLVKKIRSSFFYISNHVVLSVH